MRIGVPKEIKDHEYRVGVTPAGVRELVAAGHEVWLQQNAGHRIGFSDDTYTEAGARIVETATEIYTCPMVVKVKEPQPGEFALMHEGQVLFTYLHLAPDPELTKNLLAQGVVGIAYETVRDNHGRLPLLVPMSEVAGRLAVQAGMTGLQMANEGRGVLLAGTPGVAAAEVVVLGGGVAGSQAARLATGLGAHVTVLDVNLVQLRYLDDTLGRSLDTVYSTAESVAQYCRQADLVIGTVLLPGKRAPRLITRDLVSEMKQGAVFVDVAIDQGGCAETSRPTTHSDPYYVIDGVVHYCVTNMPGAVSRTATQALTNATLPYVMALAEKGYEQALREDPGLADGLNVYHGQVTNPGVADALGYDFISPQKLLCDPAVGNVDRQAIA